MRVLAFVLIVLMTCSISASAQEITELRQELNESNQKLIDMQTNLDYERNEAEDYNSIIASKQQKLTELKQNIASVDTEIIQLSKELDVKEEELEQVMHQLVTEEERYSIVEDSFVTSFKKVLENQRNLWQSFLDKLSLQAIIKENALIDYLAFSSGKAYAKAQENSKEFIEAKESFQAELNRLRNIQEIAKTKMTSLETGYQELKAELNKDKLDLVELRQQISLSQRNLYEHDKQVRHIEDELANKLGTATFPTKRSGTVAWPLDEKGRVSSDYGPRIHPIYNEERYHTGVDIAVPSGTPIKAVADGVVLTSESLNGYGLSVIIDHGQGLSTLYGHASKLIAEPGSRVRKGQIIALVGSTGISTGPHVHFEIRENGHHVNPWTWLQ